MLQRLFCELYLAGNIDFQRFVRSSEDEAIRLFLEASKGTSMDKLAQGLFGAKRTIYKRVAQFSILEQSEMYRQLAGKPYRQLCELADQHCVEAKAPPLSVLIDAPPVEKEVEIKIDVYFPKSDRYRALEDLSPVVRAMAKEQFDDYAKRVRIFAHPDVAPTIFTSQNET
jgi:hypothetical protein